MSVEYLGNKELLKLKKTAFLALSTISSETVLRCYDWAAEMRRRGECVDSGFVPKGAKGEYIQALIDSRENEDSTIIQDVMMDSISPIWRIVFYSIKRH